MAASNSWNEKVIPQILLHPDFLITQINELEPINELIYQRAQYPTIAVCIQNKDWEQLKAFDEKNPGGFREYLSVLKFFDQNKLMYVVTVYDSDELWQDPEIIDIFPLK